MKLQDNHPYDSTILGLNDLYIIDYEGNFYINSQCVMATDKTICTGRTYLLVDCSNGKNGRMYSVVLLDVYCEDYVIYLIVRDLLSQKIFNINFYIDNDEIRSLWVLIDMNFFIQRLKGGKYGQFSILKAIRPHFMSYVKA
jgi:hypothetical protein